MDNKYKYLLLISSVFTIFAFSNLVLRVHITKDTEHFTYLWITLNLVAQLLLFIYGIANNMHEVYVVSTIMLLYIVYILYTKVIYEETTKLEKILENKKIL